MPLAKPLQTLPGRHISHTCTTRATDYCLRHIRNSVEK